MTEIVPFTEIVAVPDTFVTGAAGAENLGDGNIRVTWFTRKASLGYPGVVENEIVQRQVCSVACAIETAKMILQAAGYQCCGGKKMRHLAH